MTPESYRQVLPFSAKEFLRRVKPFVPVSGLTPEGFFQHHQSTKRNASGNNSHDLLVWLNYEA
jgi:hypothetical protein